MKRSLADGLRRYARHLSLPEVGIAGQERLAAGSVLRRRHGWARISGGALPRRGWGRQARPGRFRRRRPLESPAPDSLLGARCRSAQARGGSRAAAGGQFRSRARAARQSRRAGQRRATWYPATTWWSTAATTSRPATWSTTPATSPAGPTSTARSSASRARRRSSRAAADPATAASSRSRRRPGRCRPAPRPGSSACCRASSDRSRPTRRSSCCSATGEPLRRPPAAVRRARHALSRAQAAPATPSCPLCGDRPTQHELVEYDDVCALPPDGPASAGSALEVDFRDRDRPKSRAAARPANVHPARRAARARAPAWRGFRARSGFRCTSWRSAWPRSRATGRSSPSATRGSGRPWRRRSCASRASARRATSPVASTPGAARSIRACRATERLPLPQPAALMSVQTPDGLRESDSTGADLARPRHRVSYRINSYLGAAARVESGWQRACDSARHDPGNRPSRSRRSCSRTFWSSTTTVDPGAPDDGTLP